MQYKIQFTEFIPDEISEGVIYISMEYATAVHKCACGCGEEVVTPFTPTDWKLTYDGESISLSPSIGNWSYPCQAHYLIRNSKVVWANTMSQEAIEAGRRRDRACKAKQYAPKNNMGAGNKHALERESQVETTSFPKTGGLLSSIARFFGFK
jgi:hypothetical protein